jgi:protocatechuate 3,4-dioxygenase alpha subunit
MPKQTPSQTVGPWFMYGLMPETYGRRNLAGPVLTCAATRGPRLRLEGRLLDGAGAPVADGLIEIWQADANGRYAHPADSRTSVAKDAGFGGFGRASTDKDGRFAFDTIKPGRVPSRGGKGTNALQAPHINVVVFARGLLAHLYTRAYFSDEAEANASDSILGLIEPARRGTLVAKRNDGPAGTVYAFDIHLQGANETVFFEA